MQHTFLDRPDFGMVLITFDETGEQIVVESGAMVARESSIQMKTSMK